MRAIAIDDEPLALSVIEGYCAQLDQVTLLATFTKQSEAQKYLVKQAVDLIFLDIEMPGKNGVEFIQSAPTEALIIYTTAYKEFALQAYETWVADYLLKPIPFERFCEGCGKGAKDAAAISGEVLPPDQGRL